MTSRSTIRARLAWPLVLLLLAQLSLAGPLLGQQSHVDMLGDLAVTCLEPFLQKQDSLLVQLSSDPGFIETQLLESWVNEGRSVGAGDRNTGMPEWPRMYITVDEARIEFERTDNSQLRRTAYISLQYRLTTPSGTLISASSCRDVAQDSMDVEAARGLTDQRYPVTQPDLPLTSTLRRIVEPIVVIGAAALGTYLFFNLRSRRADN